MDTINLYINKIAQALSDFLFPHSIELDNLTPEDFTSVVHKSR
ncbi:hypothetical protein UFOVP116_334 [uncultured Caudovirales phage]|uniref:Uncharacterized protein n=1 Tax=uncultured Caudovirales phage TaxID=2100421 RepID=A0A6J5LF25_9CAUD|nr:hypothetical protein UFOVP116_334 [uncultured Caudovirales phage]